MKTSATSSILRSLFILPYSSYVNVLRSWFGSDQRQDWLIGWKWFYIEHTARWADRRFLLCIRLELLIRQLIARVVSELSELPSISFIAIADSTDRSDQELRLYPKPIELSIRSPMAVDKVGISGYSIYIAITDKKVSSGRYHRCHHNVHRDTIDTINTTWDNDILKRLAKYWLHRKLFQIVSMTPTNSSNNLQG